MEILNFQKFLYENASADSMRDKWLDPEDNKGKYGKDTIMFPSSKGLEFVVTVENDEVVQVTEYNKKLDWSSWLSDEALKVLAKGEVKSKSNKFTNSDNLESVEIMFPNSSGVKLTVYYTSSEDEFEIDSCRLDKNGDDLGQWLSDKGIDLIGDKVTEKLL